MFWNSFVYNMVGAAVGALCARVKHLLSINKLWYSIAEESAARRRRSDRGAAPLIVATSPLQLNLFTYYLTNILVLSIYNKKYIISYQSMSIVQYTHLAKRELIVKYIQPNVKSAASRHAAPRRPGCVIYCQQYFLFSNRHRHLFRSRCDVNSS